MDKQYILDEIKRTALANRGVPLGMQGILREAGIRRSDWFGKFWVRWGDALTEAGFDPNQYITAYDKAILLRRLVELCRELGHFPLNGEIRLKGRRDATFPSHTTFNRLGPKRSRVAKVLAFCTAQGGYDDVVEMCRVAVAQEGTEREERTRNEDDEAFGFIYLLKSGRFFKIGRSNAAGRRERELAIQLPEKAELIHEIRTDDPPGIEAYWHRRFEAKRKNGEWFDLDAADVKAFQRRKFM